MAHSNRFNTPKIIQCAFLLLLLSTIYNNCTAQTLSGQWYESNKKWAGSKAPSSSDLINLNVLAKLPLTGGNFLYAGSLEIPSPGRYVLDFAHSSYIEQFEHLVYDNQGLLIASYKGGIQSDIADPYPIRHGRALSLAAGQYTFVVNLNSSFFINPPEPFVLEELGYLEDIKIGNFITSMGLGIFFVMAIFYLCFAASKRNSIDLAYAVFIIGNLLFFSISLSTAPDMFRLYGFQLAIKALFISNIAYLFFIRNLLEIKRENDPSLYWASNALIYIFALLAVLTTIFDTRSVELSHISIAICLAYGLFAGLTYALQKVVLAYYYLAANLCFLVPVIISILPDGFSEPAPTIYSSHLGIVAVSIQTLLLSLVHTYKINHERLSTADKTSLNDKSSRTDLLTGALNREAFEESLTELSENDNLTYIGLDGLKHYNDNFSYLRGDDLLRQFSVLMMNNLNSDARFFRIAGDEFAVISSTKSAKNTGFIIDQVVELLNTRGFTLCRADYGQVSYQENVNSPFNLKKIADARMCSAKSRAKQLALEMQL